MLRVKGVGGYLAGEERRIGPGEALTVGRSRTCGLSLRRSPKWVGLRIPEAKADAAYRTVSRRHASLKVLGEGRVEVEALGTNGTFVDGVRIDRVLLTDVAKKRHRLRIGESETLHLDWVEAPPSEPCSSATPSSS